MVYGECQQAVLSLCNMINNVYNKNYLAGQTFILFLFFEKSYSHELTLKNTN